MRGHGKKTCRSYGTEWIWLRAIYQHVAPTALGGYKLKARMF